VSLQVLWSPQPIEALTPASSAPAAPMPCAVPRVVDDATAVVALASLPPDTVLLVPAQGRPAVVPLLQRARKLLGRPDLALVVRRSPLTRLSLGAALVRGSGLFAPAELPAALDKVTASLRTTALLDGVGGLEQPVPSIGQHAQGWLPKTRFLVDVDAGTVRRAPARRKGVAATSTAGTAVVSASPAAPAGWFDELVAMVGPSHVDRLTATDGPEGSFWGTDRWAEATVLRRPAGDVLREVRDGLACAPCPSCRRSAAGPDCVFCGVGLRGADAPAGVAVAGPDPTRLAG
jgi:hypothetical protein